ncbi:type II CRISPR RNA-guided endonuclease Cas9 [Caviibacter abscessus]|uniref:type II CRISPR RNA-guided endonuclease Cas9 n=1 Tax=Caviibacter abscessus TaxID=1766719 RepID=UPI000829DF30|nr:type II CRISPR RNA-guided endonuclease Cas9 [Caviibacter abscessus]
MDKLKKQQFTDYYLGLDLGTSSVGWAVTDPNYNILKFNKKDMWGSRLFDEAQTAKDRRVQRNSRRRLKRRKWRLDLLERIFEEEIFKIDPTFFMRLKESNLHLEDKTYKKEFILFNDNNYTDKDFHNNYPTIYHLRDDLINTNEKKDIRLIYLALHSIFKRRGHFLFSGLSIDEIKNFQIVFENLKDSIKEILGFELDADRDNLNSILTNRTTTKKDKEKELKNILKNNQLLAIFKLVIGSKSNFKNIFIENETLQEKDNEINISFSDIIYDDKRDELVNILDEDIDLIDKCKNMYDYLLLKKILKQESSSISSSMIDSYNQHKVELKQLKYFIKKYCKEEYNNIFRDSNKNYSAYINLNSIDGNRKIINYSEEISKPEHLFKNLKSIFQKFGKINTEGTVVSEIIDESDKNIFKKLYEKTENHTLLARQRTTNNSILPYQIHKYELEKILENQSKYYEFLGIRKNEIIKIFEFRIPYYVGPLNNNSKHSWVVRKSGEITPQNFEDKVDLEQSAEKFILRMTNKCTYLREEDVLPKDSLIYGEYMVLNELNKVKINGSSDILIKYKQEIIDLLFKRNVTVTVKKLIEFLETKGIKVEKSEISGVEVKFNSSLKTYIKFFKIIGNKLEEDKYKNIVENIIRWKCLYGDDKKIFEKKFNSEYKNNELNKDEFNQILKLSFNGWGRLSAKLLTSQFDFVNLNTGEGPYKSVMEALRTNNLNLMELLSSNYDLMDKIEKENNENNEKGKNSTYKELVNESYVSPSVKRSIIQTIKIINEIKKITKKVPKKIFIETARTNEVKGKITEKRQEAIQKLYKSVEKDKDLIFEEIDSLNKEVKSFDNNKLRQKKLFLYFMQLGKCMYSGESIDISELNNSNTYDIEHIYPQSKVKDDSLDNIILVKKEINISEGDKYPKSSNIRNKMKSFWKILKDKKFISNEKYSRLICDKEMTVDQLSGFVARQLVTTRQATIEVIRILNILYPESEIIYSKAGNVSDFREKFDLIKCRELNDMHHAKDAYLNIVVGNVYNTKFTKNPTNFIKSQLNLDKKDSYNLKKIFDYDIERNNLIAWKKEKKDENGKVLKEGTISLVRNNILKNTVNITRMLIEDKGQLFNLTIKKKKENKDGDFIPAIKISGESQKLTSKYGYYDSLNPSYFVLLKYDDKNGNKQMIADRVFIKDLSKIKTHKDLEKYYEAKYKNPKIIKKIKKQQLILFDNYPYRISGYTNKSGLELKNAKSLFLENNYVKYLKDAIKFVLINEKNNENSYIFPKLKRDNNTRPETNEEAKARHEKEFIKLYNVFIEKLQSKEYANYCFNKRSIDLISQKEIFEKNSLLEKAKMLKCIIKIFNKDTNWQFTGKNDNLKLILTVSRSFKTFSKFNPGKLVFIDESITGLFNKKIIIK